MTSRLGVYDALHTAVIAYRRDQNRTTREELGRKILAAAAVLARKYVPANHTADTEQAVALSLWSSARRFNPDATDSFMAFAYQAARGSAIDDLRGTIRHRLRVSEPVTVRYDVIGMSARPEIPADEREDPSWQEPYDALEYDDLQAVLDHALDRLVAPRPRRFLRELAASEDTSRRDLAERHGMSPSRVGQIVNLGQSRMRAWREAAAL